MLWILLAAAVVATITAIYIGTNENKEEPKPELPVLGDGLGSPLFSDEEGRKQVVFGVNPNDWVWLLTPYGPQKMTVVRVEDNQAHLKNDDFEALAFYDPEYFSPGVAEKFSAGVGAWRVEKVLPAKAPPMSIPYNDPVHQMENRHWLVDESIFGLGELFDAMIFYHFLFDGFDEPFDYYQGYDPPIYEDPVIEDTPIEPVEPEPAPVEEIFDDVEPEVPAEVTEETFEEVIEEPSRSPGVEDTDIYPVVPDPEPIPEPEPERSWGGGGYEDTGGGWDSGGNDSGGDD